MLSVWDACVYLCECVRYWYILNRVPVATGVDRTAVAAATAIIIIFVSLFTYNFAVYAKRWQCKNISEQIANGCFHFGVQISDVEVLIGFGSPIYKSKKVNNNRL